MSLVIFILFFRNQEIAYYLSNNHIKPSQLANFDQRFINGGYGSFFEFLIVIVLFKFFETLFILYYYFKTKITFRIFFHFLGILIFNLVCFLIKFEN